MNKLNTLSTNVNIIISYIYFTIGYIHTNVFVINNTTIQLETRKAC